MNPVPAYVYDLIELTSLLGNEDRAEALRKLVYKHDLPEAPKGKPSSASRRKSPAATDRFKNITNAYVKFRSMFGTHCRDFFRDRQEYIKLVLEWASLTQTADGVHLAFLMINSRWFGGINSANDFQNPCMCIMAGDLLNVLDALQNLCVSHVPFLNLDLGVNLMAWEESTLNAHAEYVHRQTLFAISRSDEIAASLGMFEGRRLGQRQPSRISYSAKGATIHSPNCCVPAKFVPWELVADTNTLVYWIRNLCAQGADYADERPHADIEDLIDLYNARRDCLRTNKGVSK